MEKNIRELKNKLEKEILNYEKELVLRVLKKDSIFNIQESFKNEEFIARIMLAIVTAKNKLLEILEYENFIIYKDKYE